MNILTYHKWNLFLVLLSIIGLGSGCTKIPTRESITLGVKSVNGNTLSEVDYNNVFTIDIPEEPGDTVYSLVYVFESPEKIQKMEFGKWYVKQQDNKIEFTDYSSLIDVLPSFEQTQGEFRISFSMPEINTIDPTVPAEKGGGTTRFIKTKIAIYDWNGGVVSKNLYLAW